MILGQDFLRLARAIPIPHEDCLLFQNETETFGVLMTVKKNFGRMLCISSMMLFRVTGGDKPRTVAHLKEETVPQ